MGRRWPSTTTSTSRSHVERDACNRIGNRLDCYGSSVYADFCLGDPVPLKEVVDHVVVDGFRAMSATRTVFDLALARAHPHRVEAAIDSAVRYFRNEMEGRPLARPGGRP